MNTETIIWGGVALLVFLFAMHEVINMATGTKKQLFNQEQQNIKLQKIIELLEQQNKKD